VPDRPGNPASILFAIEKTGAQQLISTETSLITENRSGIARTVCPQDTGIPWSSGGSMAGKFVVKKGASGKYHFNLVAANGQVIATSEAYEHKQSALHGIESVKENAPGAEVDDQTGE
jgi:uncharacterized protein YegP (UPF0339 family)